MSLYTNNKGGQRNCSPDRIERKNVRNAKYIAIRTKIYCDPWGGGLQYKLPKHQKKYLKKADLDTVTGRGWKFEAVFILEGTNLDESKIIEARKRIEENYRTQTRGKCQKWLMLKNLDEGKQYLENVYLV